MKEIVMHMRNQHLPEAWNRIAKAVIGPAIEVHGVLGPGLLERLHKAAPTCKRRLRGLSVERQRPIRLFYKRVQRGEQVLDPMVNRLVIVVLKAVDKVHEVHPRQLVSSMKSAMLPPRLRINSNAPLLRGGFHRRILSASARGHPAPGTEHSPRASASTAHSVLKATLK